MRSCFLAATFVTMASGGFGAPALTYSAPQESGIQLLIPASQEFHNELRTITSGRSNTILTESIAYSVIVKNATQRHIACVVIVYDLKNDFGQPIFHRYQLGTLFKLRDRMLAPGKALLIGPVPFLYDAVNRGQIAHPSLTSDNAVRDARTRLSRYTNQEAIRVSLDSVVFEDGELVGEDRTKTLERLNADLRAERDIRQFASVSSAQQIRTRLEEILRQPQRPAASPMDMDHYQEKLRALAPMMLLQLQDSEELFRSHMEKGSLLLMPEVFRRKQ